MLVWLIKEKSSSFEEDYRDKVLSRISFTNKELLTVEINHSALSCIIHSFNIFWIKNGRFDDQSTLTIRRCKSQDYIVKALFRKEQRLAKERIMNEFVGIIPLAALDVLQKALLGSMACDLHY